MSEQSPSLHNVPEDSLAMDANADHRIPWFMRKNYRNDPRYTKIDEDIKPLADQFMQDGFIVLKADISSALCDKMVSDFNNFTAINADYFNPHRDEFGYLHRIINLHLALPTVFDVFSSATTTLRLQDSLFGDQTSVYTTLYYERGSSQTIHRDTPYFTTRPEYSYFGTWFALEDAHEQNGCLEVIRGGHLIPEIDRTKFAEDNRKGNQIGAIDPELFDLYQNKVGELSAEWGMEKVQLPLSKGDVLIWHPQLPHGGSPILNRALTRHSIVAHTVAAGTPVYQAEAFFNPRANLPDSAIWPLAERNNRTYVDHGIIDVMHVDARPVSEFCRID